MSNALVTALLRELLDDPEALAALKRALDVDQPSCAPPPAYTVETLGRAIGMGDKAIRNAITDGELRARKRRGRWLITPTDVDAWLGSADSERRSRAHRRVRSRPLGSTFDGIEGWR